MRSGFREDCSLGRVPQGTSAFLKARIFRQLLEESERKCGDAGTERQAFGPRVNHIARGRLRDVSDSL